MGDGAREDKDAKERVYLREYFNVACVLRVKVKHLEKIKEYVISEYVNKGLVKLIWPTYGKKKLYTLAGEEWEEYETLKQRKALVGAESP